MAKKLQEERKKTLRNILGLLIIFAVPILIRFDMALAQAKEEAALDNSRSESIDDVFGRIATKVPEFGGMFYEQETLVVNMTAQSPALEEAVITAIKEEFAQVRDTEQNIIFREVKYGFNQLREWYEPLAYKVFPIDGVTFTDIDEMNNRLVIGIESLNHKPAVEELVDELRIPPEVVEIRKMGPFITDASESNNFPVTSIALFISAAALFLVYWLVFFRRRFKVI